MIHRGAAAGLEAPDRIAETWHMALRRDAKIDLLRKVPLFERVPRRELARVAALAEEVEYPQGVALLTKGSRDDGFFILLQGEVDVRRGTQLLQTLKRGQFFGEIALLADVPRTATVTTGTPVEALRIARSDFKRLLSDSPSLALKVLEELAYRLQTTALAGPA
jgi:CRP-like cAMP-binding protein